MDSVTSMAAEGPRALTGFSLPSPAMGLWRILVVTDEVTTKRPVSQAVMSAAWDPFSVIKNMVCCSGRGRPPGAASSLVSMNPAVSAVCG